MTFLAPCGHPGVPIIGTYVSCLSCDGKPKSSTPSLPERFYVRFFSGPVLLPSTLPDFDDLIITAIARPSSEKKLGFEIERGIYTIKGITGGELTYWRTCTFEDYAFIAQGLLRNPSFFPGSTDAVILNSVLEHLSA